MLFEILVRLFAKVNVQKIDAARKGARSCFNPSGSILNAGFSASQAN